MAKSTISVNQCDTPNCAQTDQAQKLAICAVCGKYCCFDHRLEGIRHSTHPDTLGEQLQVFVCLACQTPLKINTRKKPEDLRKTKIA